MASVEWSAANSWPLNLQRHPTTSEVGLLRTDLQDLEGAGMVRAAVARTWAHLATIITAIGKEPRLARATVCTPSGRKGVSNRSGLPGLRCQNEVSNPTSL